MNYHVCMITLHYLSISTAQDTVFSALMEQAIFDNTQGVDLVYPSPQEMLISSIQCEAADQ